MQCRHCKAQLDPKNKYCIVCGTAVNEEVDKERQRRLEEEKSRKEREEQLRLERERIAEAERKKQEQLKQEQPTAKEEDTKQTVNSSGQPVIINKDKIRKEAHPDSDIQQGVYYGEVQRQVTQEDVNNMESPTSGNNTQGTINATNQGQSTQKKSKGCLTIIIIILIFLIGLGSVLVFIFPFIGGVISSMSEDKRDYGTTTKSYYEETEYAGQIEEETYAEQIEEETYAEQDMELPPTTEQIQYGVPDTLSQRDLGSMLEQTYGYYDAGDFILPDSSNRYIAAEELYGLSKGQLRIARNEIYARHGRKFKDQGLQDYFNSKSWYIGSIEADSFSEDLITPLEKANLITIREVEDALP